ncbi:hypothetical protein A2392_01455 [Candidatus Kaiserbacteria bacterium RIFOXYB1_FULL_46_14]|uniref:Ribulose phosphate epimerase n=1 Tax=Candidatus Kaiserbacteria bacterium RIFOXYB1_FULL_46_14 TaxID=1798531 RepID=A0A1F6FJR8_9BACT|nr:MAG: hypothetical protein A2392_01455 [Candidatus Kaiserbacteria bacterium RIFOXYB1_FULL_46_14]
MIIPAIIPKSLDDLKDKLALLSFAPAVQIDLVDGKFVENVSWPYEPVGAAADATALIEDHEIEVDLMVDNPVLVAKDWLTIGAKRIVIHLESLSSVEDILSLKDNTHVLLGLAINNDTPIERLHPFVDQIDFVQLMGIASIGKQGEPFDDRVIDRITTIRSLYPNLTITVDGAVGKTNLAALKNAGANRFVVGSAILNSADPESTYEDLLKIIAS